MRPKPIHSLSFAPMIDAILAIEEQNNLWEPQVLGIKLWPLIRVFLMDSLVMRARNYEPFPRQHKAVYLLLPKWPRYLRTLLLFASDQRDIHSMLFFCDNYSHYPLNNGKYSYNRLYGELFRLIGSPLIFETSPSSYWAKPDRDYESFIFSQDAIWLWSTFRAKTRKLSRSAIQEIENFVQLVTCVYDFPLPVTHLVNMITRYVKEFSAVQLILDRYIVPKLKCRTVLVEGACFLGHKALLTKSLHNLGCDVFELQHGTISHETYAYRISDAYNNNPNHPSHAYYPDYLLMYGEYWTQIAKVPSQKIVVGSPQLSMGVERAKINVATVNGQILVLSQPTIRSKVLEVINQLAQSFPGRHLILKLHPLEFGLENEISHSVNFSNVEIVGQADVHQLIAASEVVVGYSTTVLVEAVAFSGKRIFFGETGIFSASIGDFFSDAEVLVKLINDPTKGLPQISSEMFWASDWQRRLREFLNAHLCQI